MTAQLGSGVEANPDFWWIIRGVENLPVRIGGIPFPDDGRLRLYTVENYDADPFGFIDLCNTANAGMLYQVPPALESGNLDFLEAILRAYIDGAPDPLLLSSGTEDYFLANAQRPWRFPRGNGSRLPQSNPPPEPRADGVGSAKR